MQSVQYVTDTEGKALYVQVPVKEYDRLLAAAEELADIVAYKNAKKNAGKAVPFEEAFREIEAYHQQQAS